MNYIINPRTSRKIQIGNTIWKKLTEEEKYKGVQLWNEKNEIKTGECVICTELTIVLNTKCCRQILCKDCYIKTRTFTCPFCRQPEPIKLTDKEIIEKQSNISQQEWEYEIYIIDLADEEIQIVRNRIYENIQREIEVEIAMIDDL